MGQHLAYVVTSALSLQLLLQHQLRFLQQQGYKITVITAPSPLLAELKTLPWLTIVEVPMEREISLTKDLKSLFLLIAALRKIRPDILNVATPKASLLGMVAGWFARVPLRVYQQWGLRLETMTGVKRLIMLSAEKLAAACSTHIVCVSASLMQRCLDLKIAPAKKMRVLGLGGSNGVDMDRFRPKTIDERETPLRQLLNIPAEALVLGFVGRLTRDKGVVDLVNAFTQLRAQQPNLHLLLVGGFEAGDPIPQAMQAQIEADPTVHLTGFVPDAAPYYREMDLFVFPSYREGLPNAPLEASATQLPVVGYAVTGTVDAIEHDVTGLTVHSGDAAKLMAAISRLLKTEELRQTFGRNGRERVEVHFSNEVVWRNWVTFYTQISNGELPTSIQTNH